jgi:hypothetical protein
MRINAININSKVYRAQGAIKKIAPVSKPRTFAIEEVSQDTSSVELDNSMAALEKHGPKNRLDTLGSEVDVWV